MSWVFLTILVAIIVGDVLWWWHADRLARRAHQAFPWRLLLGLFMGAQVGLLLWILGGRALGGSPWSRPPQVLSAAAYLWHLLLLPAAWVVVVTAGMLWWIWRSWRHVVRVTARKASFLQTVPLAEESEDDPTRRQFLGMVTAVTPPLLTGSGVAYSLSQLQQLRIRSLDVVLPSLPAELDGLRLALVSDLHVGTFTSSQAVERIVEETSRLDADLVLLPGDLINNSLSDLSDALDAVANMQSRHGAYLSLGNHDLIENGAEFVRRVRARLPLLVEESRTVLVRGHPVQLLGLPWANDEQRIARSVQHLAKQVATGAFPILLAHHPHAFDAAAAAGIPLTVAGHTHGGQLMLSESVGCGPLMYRYWSGLYRKAEQGAALVVSNGAGHWFPLRTGAPAEIIHLTLRSVQQTG